MQIPYRNFNFSHFRPECLKNGNSGGICGKSSTFFGIDRFHKAFNAVFIC